MIKLRNVYDRAHADMDRLKVNFSFDIKVVFCQ